MVKKSRKLIQWRAKDFARVLAFFCLHTLILLAGFAFILYINANFDYLSAWNFITSEGTAGNFVYLIIAIVMIVIGTFLFFYSENRDFIYRTRNVNMTFIVLEISVAILFAIGKYLIYARPFALCALLILLLVDKRTAIFMNTACCLLMFLIDAFLSINPIEDHLLYSSFIIGWTTSIIAIHLVNGSSSRVKVFFMGFVIAIPVIICALCLEFDDALINPFIIIVAGFTSGMSSVVLMMALLPLFEKIFNRTTDYKLAELTDNRSPIITKLRNEASGTYHHCLDVSNLAEACAVAIGENPLLARACAYYHDIGKLENPEFFTENQRGYNPHIELTPELSTDTIRSHAKYGYELAKKYRLPDELADITLQHHGTLPIRYFYVQASKISEEPLNIENFYTLLCS